MILGGAPPLLLELRMCAGLGRHLCCSFSAYGQTVVATGRLQALPGDEAAELGSPWILKSPSVCEEKPLAR